MTVEQLLAGVVIPIDKPRQWTSFQAVNKVKSAIRNHYGLKKFKIGHAGTLDPLATGLLLVCVGKATKEIERLQQGEKVYSGTMVLGATTPCYDLERAIDCYYPTQQITREKIEEARQQFEGEIAQVPPMFSAVKIAGQRAYQYARKDDPEAMIQPKNVVVHSFEITDVRNLGMTPPYPIGPVETIANGEPMPTTGYYNHPEGVVPEGMPEIDFRIRCGKGTYIRSIARDMGLALESGAFLASLRRERIGDYTLERCVGLEERCVGLDSLEDYFTSNE